MLQIEEIERRVRNDETIENEDIDEVRKSGEDISALTLRHCRIARFEANDCDARGAVLSECELPGAVIGGGDFRSVDLSHVHIKGGRVFRVQLEGAILDHAVFDGTLVEDCTFHNLTGAQLKGARFQNCAFPGCEFAHADLTDAVFEACDFTGARLALADCRHAEFRDCLFAPGTMNWFAHPFVGQLLLSVAGTPERRAWARYVAHETELCLEWAETNPMPPSVQDWVVPLLASRIGPNDRGPKFLLQYFREYQPHGR